MAYFLLLLIALPFAEIYVLLKAGGAFGLLPVMLATVFTAILGGFIIKIQGMNAVSQLRHDMQDARVPVEPVADGVFLLICAPLLMTPGFITDFIGFSLLVPPIRHFFAKRFLRWLKGKVATGEARMTIIRPNDPPR